MKFTIIEVVDDMPNEDYHSHGEDIISSSFVKNVVKHSVQQALDETVDTTSEPLIFGDLFHTRMEFNGKDKLDDRVHLWEAQEIYDNLLSDDWCQANLGRGAYDSPKMTNVYKKAQRKAQAQADKSGTIAFSRADYDMINAMAESAFSHNFVREYRENPDHTILQERSYFAVEEESGISVRIRPDEEVRGPLGEIRLVNDWKSTKYITKFRKSFFRYRYDVQAVFYSDVLDIDPANFYFTATEKREHPITRVYSMKDDTIKRARRDMQNAWDQIVEWRNTGKTLPPNKEIVNV